MVCDISFSAADVKITEKNADAVEQEEEGTETKKLYQSKHSHDAIVELSEVLEALKYFVHFVVSSRVQTVSQVSLNCLPA